MGKKVHVPAVDDGMFSALPRDINDSYSADLIAMHGTIRKPFLVNGQLYTIISGGGTHGVQTCEGYRIVEKVTWHSRTRRYPQMRIEQWQRDPRGFYNGMVVKWLKKEYVMVGPPIHFYYQRNLPFREGDPPGGWNIWDEYAERHYGGPYHPRNNQRHAGPTEIPLLAGLHAAPGFCSRGMMMRDRIQIRV